MSTPRLPDGRYAILPDLQVPFHDKKALDHVCSWLASGNFDGLLNVGDESDSPNVSRWNKASAMEYAPVLDKHLTETHKVMRRLSEAVGWAKPHHVMRSNHADRLEKYIARYAPALHVLKPLKWEAMMGYGQPSTLTGDTLPITFHRQVWEFAPGWVLAHGDEGRLSQVPSSTALGLAKKFGRSCVCGHSHRAGVQHLTMGFNGRATVTLTGVEVGNLMDMRSASYLGGGSGNWRQAVAVATIKGRVCDVTLKLLHNGQVVG